MTLTVVDDSLELGDNEESAGSAAGWHYDLG
jgi:hypothetical protein